MIKNNGTKAKVMEFTSFRKKEGITDDELIASVLAFEKYFLATETDILFHCLVRNSNGDYANVLFAESLEKIKKIEGKIMNNPIALDFFSLIDKGSAKLQFHQICKDDFEIPTHFSCIEVGTFSLINQKEVDSLLKVSKVIEEEYLFKFENTKAHFIGIIDNEKYSEVTFGSTLEDTKKICHGYTQNQHCMPMLEMANTDTMELDFWNLIE